MVKVAAAPVAKPFLRWDLFVPSTSNTGFFHPAKPYGCDKGIEHAGISRRTSLISALSGVGITDVFLRASRGCSASQPLITFHIFMLVRVWSLPNVFFLSRLHGLCMLKRHSVAHLCVSESCLRRNIYGLVFIEEHRPCLKKGDNSAAGINEVRAKN